MARKRREDCGRFMRLTDRLPDDDEFDEQLAIACGLTDEQIDEAQWDYDGEHSRFHYVNDQWECEHCETVMADDTGRRYYWNPASGNYDGERPLTPKQRAALEAHQQEKAGQLRLL